MNLIVEKSPRIKSSSDLYPFFIQLEALVRRCVWLWSDVEVNLRLPVELDPSLKCWIDGSALFEFVAQRPLFEWSVLDAISPENKTQARSVNCTPFADGNPNLWSGVPRPQHPDADFEIVCWDSSATLLIGANETVASAFRAAYPDATDLDDANSRRTRSNVHIK